MQNEYKQSKEELQQHLKDIIEALELSSRAYDTGLKGEAKRLAAGIRVLLHDTDSSKSLLGQLGKKNINFYDTTIPYNPKTFLTYNGLTAMNLTPEGATYECLFDELPPDSPPRWVSFDEWWNRLIFIDRKGIKTTRKDLILAIANKDGGTHVDPNLDERYANLSRRNLLAWRFSSPKGDFPLEGPERAATRQITHEVLKSINPTMPNIKLKAKGTLFFGGFATVDDKQPPLPKVSRNAPCPCGSGKKYKRCHGKS